MLSPSTRHDGSRPIKTLPDEKGLGQAPRIGLLGVFQLQAPLRPVPQKTPKQGQVEGRADDQNLPHPRQHQGRERVIDHRLVVNGQELLAHDARRRIEPRAGPSGKNDSLAGRRRRGTAVSRRRS